MESSRDFHWLCLANVTGKLQMTFTTGNLIITNQIDFPLAFKKAAAVPGYSKLVDNGRSDVIDFLNKNLENPALCIQASVHQTVDPVVYNDSGDLCAAYGWCVTETLGRGKDGIVFLGYRYDDTAQKIKTAKIFTRYGLQYINHTILFTQIVNRVKKKNPGIFELTVRDQFMYYDYSEPLTPTVDDDFEKNLVDLCYINSWSIKNTGFVFWDFGYGSGKNYMLNRNGSIVWIDYGGAGLLRCPNFESIYCNYKNLSPVNLEKPFDSKTSLVIADSDFVMCQFLLHYEYWKNKENSNADLWASMLQIRRSAIPEFVEFLPNFLRSDLARSIYNEFRNCDWCDYITWKQVGKYINANT
jgi:hypothetical protein